jgi:hypothetical protein
MNAERITQALRAASQVLKGAKPDGITAAALTDALLSLGDTRKFAGETREACFARLIRENDPDATTLAKAADALYVAEQQGSAERRTAKARLHASANDLLDDFVAKNRRPDEAVAQAVARLARDSEPTFTAIWSHLRAIQDAAD